MRMQWIHKLHHLLMGRESSLGNQMVGLTQTRPSPVITLLGGGRRVCTANGTAGALAGLDRSPTAFIPTTERPDLIPGRGHCGAGRWGSTPDKKADPAPKFAHSLTRCTKISEESVMDVAHGEMVEAELTPAGAQRTAWRGASTTTNRPNATGPSKGTRIGATTSPSYEEVDF
jgi:hypothetical protein